jgi:phage host-nuclease inhibitor protein Gam
VGKKSKSLKTSVPAMEVPQDHETADKYLLYLSQDCNGYEHVDGELQDMINELKAQFGDKLQPLRERIVERFTALVNFTNAHKAEITIDGARSKRYPSGGTLGFHKNPPHVEYDGGEAELIKWLEDMGYGEELVETKKTLKLSAIKDFINKSDSVIMRKFKLESTEDVVVEPPGLADKADVRKLLKLAKKS